MTIAFIRRHIFRIPLQRLFTTREFLIYGPRSAIDKGLSRLVRKGVIIRVSRGVFIRDGSNVSLISPLEIALAKAQSFGKQVTRSGEYFAQELKLLNGPKLENVFAVNGSSSSLRYGDITIYFKRTCARKMQFSESQAGKILRALWALGRFRVDVFVVEKALGFCLRDVQQEIRRSLCSLPTWLSSYFVKMTLPRAAFENYPPVVKSPT